jgi:hypothetical protein
VEDCTPGDEAKMKVGHLLVAAVMGTVAFLFARGLVRDIYHVFETLSSGLQVK